MRIIVDGDACPGISIIERCAKDNNLDLIVYCDIHHYIVFDYAAYNYIKKYYPWLRGNQPHIAGFQLCNS